MGGSRLGAIVESNHCFTNNSAELGCLIKSWAECDVSGTIGALLTQAADLVLEGRLAAALALLEYAQRKAPSHSLVTLFIGDLRLCLDRSDAAEPFDLIARRGDWRGAWIRLAISHSRAKDFSRAAADLHETLSRNAPQLDRAFCGFAAEISKMSSAHGWCGVDNTYVATIGGAAARYKVSDLTFVVDGRVVQLTQQKQPARSHVRHFDITEYREGRSLKVLAKGLPLIGSPVSIQAVYRVEGFVEATAGGCTGWCWLPGEPNMAPMVSMGALTSTGQVPACTQMAGPIDDSDVNAQKLIQPRKFSFTHDQVAEFNGPITVCGPRAAPLYGSPLNPGAAAQSNRTAAQAISSCFPARGAAPGPTTRMASLISIPADMMGCRVHAPVQDRERSTLIVIPVYRGLKSTLECLHTVLAHKTEQERILVISDASPEPDLVKALARLAETGNFEFREEPINQGFPTTANVGLRRAAEMSSDIILLNSDTLVTQGWVSALRDITYGSDDIGTATPLSNAATLFSYPSMDRPNPTPTLEECQDYARLAARANHGLCIDVPTGHGFCLYIRLECVLEVGLLREDVFAQGYGEENDFCLRARALGWRNVAAPDAFVGHLEGQSFGAAKAGLSLRNLKILNRLHPGYDKLIVDWQKTDPLGPSRRRIDMARWVANQRGRDSTLLVTHDRGGGVLRHVDQRAAKAEANGLRAIICKPAAGADLTKQCVIDDIDHSYPNLVFEIPGELPLVVEFLAASRIKSTELHHFIGHAADAVDALTSISPFYEVHIHDYSWFCPRITLTAEKHHYCGEPDLKHCTVCVQDFGSNLGYDVDPAVLRSRSLSVLSGAQRVIVPSLDTHRRITRRFGVDAVISPWEDETGPLMLKQIPPLLAGQRRRVCVAGAIGYEKGYDVILDCARMVAAKSLPIDFVVVGFTCDDDRLLQTGCVRITGRYDESEAVALLKQQNADVGLLPALWPETWSYILTQFWQAFLPVVTFDIGTPSARIRARNGGFVLPFGSSTQQIVEALLTLEMTP